MDSISKQLNEEEVDTKKLRCHGCRMYRVMAALNPNHKNIISICQNKKCFLYTDMSKLESWKLQTK